MTKIKICGITNPDDAMAAVELGADALGFIFFRESKRYINPADASKIMEKLPRDIKKVGVFVNSEVDEVNEIAKTANLDLLQIHGDETLEYCAELELPYIKAVRVRDEGSLGEIEGYNTDYLLFDTYSKDEYGGSGRAFDWNILRGRKFKNKYVILSGGLNDKNVGEAISLIKPYGVDVSSGVEERPGKKDIKKIKKFIEAVRNGDKQKST